MIAFSQRTPPSFGECRNRACVYWGFGGDSHQQAHLG
jgi:hypothetical protein